MKIEYEFERVCKLAGLVEIRTAHIAQIPTWKTPDGLEAVELKKEKVINFWFKDGERIYNTPAGSKIDMVMKAFELRQESTPDIKQDLTLSPPNKTQLISDVLSIDSFERWQKMSISDRFILLQTTDTRYICERADSGGRTYKYVDGSYTIMCANMAFGFQWSSSIQQWEKTDKEIICIGYIEAKVNGELIRKSAIGHKDIATNKDSKEYLCIGDDYKFAEMDMIQRALSFFGIAKDVYSNEVRA